MNEGGDRRFEPTSARKRRAVREGNVARSAELSTVVAFAAATVAAAVAVPLAAVAAAALMRRVAAAPGAPLPAAQLGALACAALAPACAAALGGTLASLAQGGLHLAAPRLQPKRLDPIAGIKRIASADGAIALARAACAFAAALCALVPLVRDAVAGAGAVSSPGAAATLVGTGALRALVTTLGVAAAFAVADVVLARRRWLRGLRMSLDELKRDAKENDGDRQARARRKSAHRAVLRGGVSRRQRRPSSSSTRRTLRSRYATSLPRCPCPRSS
jgi:flagellar biosynthesis protein FlhB